MRKRHPNPGLVKKHRSYTVEEAAILLDKHKNTVRHWIKTGLATVDDMRPTLILGRELCEFLRARRIKNKQSCEPGQLYCVRCRTPKFPDERIVDYVPLTEKFGNLVGFCPDCNSIINRRVSLAKIWESGGNLDISFPQALRHIVNRRKPTVNSESRQEG